MSHFLSAAISVSLATAGCQTTTNTTNGHLDSPNTVSGFMAIWFGHVTWSENQLKLILDPVINDTNLPKTLENNIKEYNIMDFPSPNETITGSLYVSPGQDNNSIYYVQVAKQTASSETSSQNINTNIRQMAFIVNNDAPNLERKTTEIQSISTTLCGQMTQKAPLPYQLKFMGPTKRVPDVHLSDSEISALLTSNMSSNVNLLTTIEDISDYPNNGCYITATLSQN